MKLVSILTQRLALLALLRLILDANIFRPKLHESVFRACCVVLCFLAWLFEEDIRKAARPLMTNFLLLVSHFPHGRGSYAVLEDGNNLGIFLPLSASCFLSAS